MLHTHLIPALEDNFIFIVTNSQTHRGVVVDPTVPQPVLEFLKQKNVSLEAIFLTHHHGDHIGGVGGLHKALGPVPTYCHISDGPRIPLANAHLTPPCTLSFLGEAWQVTHLPGHTLNHIVYFLPSGGQRPPWLFCGDVVFGCGCGKLFEGTHENLFNALQWVAGLPPQTRVFCSHEYTLENGAIAQKWLPHDEPLKAYLERKKDQRGRGEWTVPLLLEEEMAANPFFRWRDPAIQKAVGSANGLEVVSCLRRWRDAP